MPRCRSWRSAALTRSRFANPDKFWDFVPKEARFNDGTVHLAPVGQYQPNAWGLHNMIGNVAEWTLDDYRPYPYQPQTRLRRGRRGGAESGSRRLVGGPAKGIARVGPVGLPPVAAGL